jgi:hypothetical protein
MAIGSHNMLTYLAIHLDKVSFIPFEGLFTCTILQCVYALRFCLIPKNALKRKKIIIHFQDPPS